MVRVRDGAKRFFAPLNEVARQIGAHLRQVCGPIFDCSFQYFSSQMPYFPQFSAVFRHIGQIEQTGLPTGFFCTLQTSNRPDPAEMLENRDSGVPQKRFT